LTALAIAASGCSAHSVGGEGQAASPTARPRGPNAATQSAEIPALRAAELGRVESATFGPYLGMRADGALVVWAALKGNERRFSASALSAQGRPLAPPTTLGSAPEQLGVVAVRAMREGYALVFTSPSNQSELVEAQCATANGEARGAPSTIAEGPGRVLWVELVPVEQGALALYAVRPSERQKAEVWAVALDSQCRAVERTMVFRNALAWQGASAPKGAFVSVVQPGEASGGAVSVAMVDGTAKVKSTTRVSSDGADLDLDAVSLGERVVLSWTDRRWLDPSVMSAAVDAAGKVVAQPARLTLPEGEQALLRLVQPSAGGKRAFVAFERTEARPPTGRYFSLSALDELGHLSGARTELGYANEDGGMPELSAAGDNLVALTVAPVCRRGKSCDGSDTTPTFVRFDGSMNAVASEPLRLEALRGERAELGFGLGCWSAKCIAITALARVPAPIFATELEARSQAWSAPVRQIDTQTRPRVKELESLARADSLARLSVASSAGQNSVAYISDFDDSTPWKLLDRPAADGRREPLRAQIGLLTAGKSTPVQVSLRAQAIGGVAVAPGDAARGDLAVAWAGLDSGVPQVFVTLFDKNGAKLSQRMLTHKKGDVSDIALSWVGDGWVVTWVDERSQDPEVYAVKVDAKLNRTSPEQRITNAPGAAADLNLAFDGKTLQLVWSDVRGADASEHADIYSVRLRPRDAAREGNELRVAATRAHSFGPALYPSRGGFAIAWVERGDENGGGRIAFGDISADGAASAPVSVALPDDAEPRAVALDCPESCHVVVAAEGREQGALFAGAFQGGKLASLAKLLALPAGVTGAAAPVLRGDTLWFAGRVGEQARVRRVQVEW
jgi:hypothetical protein